METLSQLTWFFEMNSAVYTNIIEEQLQRVGVITSEHPKVLATLLDRLQFFGPIEPNSVFFDFKKKCRSSAALLEVSTEKFIKAACKHPQLFYAVPETINSNAEDTAALLGITKAQFVEVTLRQPTLLCLSPAKVNAHAEDSATLLGITKTKFIEAALKKPSLFCYTPETVAEHGRLMHRFAEKGLVARDVENYYLNKPAILTLSDDNFHLRRAYAAYSGAGSPDNFLLLRATRTEIERAFVKALGHDPDCATITTPKPAKVNIRGEQDLKDRILVSNIQNGLLKGYSYEPEQG